MIIFKESTLPVSRRAFAESYLRGLIEGLNLKVSDAGATVFGTSETIVAGLTIKIAMIGPYPPQRCGVGDYTRNLLYNMKQHEFSFTVIAPKNGLAARNEHDDFADAEIVRKWKKESPLYPLDLAVAIAKVNPDIVHIQHEYGSYGRYFGFPLLLLLLWCKLVRRPVVITLHTVWSLDRLEDSMPHPERWKLRVAKEIFRQLTWLISVLVDRVHVMNPRAVDELVNNYNVKEEKLVHVSHGTYEMTAVDTTSAKKAMRLGEKFVIMCFGFAFPSKGYEYAIMAMQELSKACPNSILVIAGGYDPMQDPEQLKSCKDCLLHLKTIVQLNRLEKKVVFFDLIDKPDIPFYLSAADLYLFPYLPKTGISTVFYQVASLRKPVVVTDIDCFAEIVDGSNGIVIPPKDPDSIGKAIERLWKDEKLRTKLGMQLYSKIVNECSWEQVGKDIRNLYVKTLNQTSRKADA